MAETTTIKLNPHPDIELNQEREEIKAFLTMPDAGINPDTGIIMVVNELGELADSDYQKNELRPYLANKLNCIAVGVNYFGVYRNSQIQIRPSFLHNINRIYNMNLTLESFTGVQSAADVYRIIAEAVVAKGITSLDLRCQPHLITGKDEYQSWGFLPAVDCLQVLGEVLQRYQLNTRKILAFGKRYGAYIALLMGKYAPHTFSTIIDREAYSRVELKHVVSGEIMEADYLFSFDLNNNMKFYIASACNNPWTIENESVPHYFSDSHRQIRSLLFEKHRIPSETCYHIFHSEDNGVTSIYDKDRCVEILQRYNMVFYNRIPAGDKEAGQTDMELFERFLMIHGEDIQKNSTDTDFSLDSNYIFNYGDKSYEFKFDSGGRIQVSIIYPD
ncbi:DUF2920 family protein [Syntrophomonas wolfei]|jgi:hypothetical protein|uniref:DUF2920 family protein n=1 Tax=Syntrophomonas wolfei TaxID=863 RepID=UPI0007737EE7|nr:DUF2920 family protein [Syntrophomonas wolfei]